MTLIKLYTTLKSDLILLNIFENQPYILAIFNDDMTKVIISNKNDLLLRRDLIK